jgi:radical SAM protein with 4Fe4S-binding SPASM domain
LKKYSLDISFYGGEPFINSDLVKKIVSFSKILFTDWELSFGATTNATMLTDEIIEYLIAEDFNILISLDGPSKIHNSKRVYKNGKGTFEDVWKNLERIKNRNAEYFNRKISFNFVHSFDQSISDIFDFFTETELIYMNKINYSNVVSKNTDYYERINYDKEEFRNDFKLIFKKIKTKHKNSKQLRPIEEIFYRDYFVNKIFNTKPRDIFSGACYLNSRLFMDVEGKFHICESINNRFPIGDVWRGFDFDRMIEIAKQFVNIKKKYCFDCDINYLCRPCYVVFASDGTLEWDKKFCSNARKSVIKNLKRQIRFEEYMRTIKKKKKLKIFKFHQFISVMKGPVNTAIADFIKGDIYHVPTKIIHHFEEREYEKIPEFIEDAKEASLIIHVKNNTCIPKQNFSIKELKYFDEISKKDIVLCVEEGVDLSLVQHHVFYFNISRIIFYGAGAKRIDNLFPGVEIDYEKPDYLKCSNLSVIKKTDFVKTDEELYRFSQVCNNCWGHKISITKDGMIRPCIYSNIVIDDMENLNSPKTIEKIQSYWYITKDIVEKCKECELRYFCIDCRELAQRESNGNLFASNPNCKYDPHTGVWQDD